ncbi:MAG: ABC transporter substrate-binding protein [Acetobacteraceae bacterium]
MTQLRRRALLAAPFVLRAVGAAAAPSVLRIGDQRGGAQPLMEAAGVLHDLPYRLEWSQFAGAPMLMEALNADAIDAGGIGDAPLVSGIASAIPMRAVSVTQSDGAVTSLVVPHDSPIHTVAALKGRSIATLRGQTGHFLVLAALDRAGMKPSDVRFVFIAPAEAKAALAAGSVDAWATWGPYIALATVQDGAREIVNGRDPHERAKLHRGQRGRDCGQACGARRLPAPAAVGAGVGAGEPAGPGARLGGTDRLPARCRPGGDRYGEDPNRRDR